jgi:hypothetical protein
VSNLVELLVDGIQVSLGQTQRLLQADPYPGGHRYKVAISGKHLMRYFPDIVSTESPDRKTQWSIFYGLDRVVGAEKIRQDTPASFLLNTVGSVHRSEDGLIIEGVCSPVIAN